VTVTAAGKTFTTSLSGYAGNALANPVGTSLTLTVVR